MNYTFKSIWAWSLRLIINTSKQSLGCKILAAIVMSIRLKAEAASIAVDICNNEGTEPLSAGKIVNGVCQKEEGCSYEESRTDTRSEYSRVLRTIVLVSNSILMNSMEKTSHLRSHECILRECRRSDDLPSW
jgi:hypothetical protein